jgi:hypothetical protein
MRTPSGGLLPGLLLVAACSGSGSNGAAPAPSGMASCATATAVGAPITAELLAKGCADREGRVVQLTPYVCRGTGNLVVTYGRSVGGPLPLALLEGVPASDPPTTAYGVWAPAAAGDPSETTDAAGCEKPPQ